MIQTGSRSSEVAVTKLPMTLFSPLSVVWWICFYTSY